MEQDITPKLWESIQKTFWANLKQITKGKSYKDADNYADLVGQAMAKAFHDNAVNLPNDKMYFNIADRLIKGALKQSHELVANYTANVQTALNRQAGLGIKGIKANMDEVKVKNLVEVACNAERYSEVAPKVEQAMTSFARSVVADTMKKNVELHYKLGLSPKIVRKLGRGSSKKRSTSGADCEFCTERVGTFHYNKDNINKGIFSRHAHCTCTLEYFPGKGAKAEKVRAWQSMEEQENRSEYKTLSETLGRRLQVSLSDFQEMKYNNSEEYKELAERAEWLRSEFPSEKSLNGHFNKHRNEFHYELTKEKYNEIASVLLSESIGNNIIGYDTNSGRRVRYDKKNNIIAIGSRTSTGKVRINTLLRPKERENYYNENYNRDHSN
ncbi:hypothetical protein [Lactobacillus iners]|uniref:hypothetical protein n=1 Tax=Lactobacillus iners TaxID=147802 RepID=UPI001F494F66|nr:hypothetical protein [Lactobacillus iners]